MALKKVVSVIGGRKCSKEVEYLSRKIGFELAKVAEILVTGGAGGVMSAVCEGFKKNQGSLTIGMLPGYDKGDANSYVDVVIPTGLGLARNVLVVASADAVVAMPGESGTLSEIAYCLQLGIPVISLGSWDISGVLKASTVEEAVQQVRKILAKKKDQEP